MKRRMALLYVIALAFTMIAGCAGKTPSPPPLKIGDPQDVVVQGKKYTYVAVHSGGSFLDHTMLIDRYGPEGLVAHDVISNNGILETLGGSALSTMVPAASALGLVK